MGQSGQPFARDLCSILKNFPSTRCSQLRLQRPHLDRVLKHLALEKLLSLGLAAICFKEPNTKYGMLGV